MGFQDEKTKTRTVGFVGLSSMAHFSLALAIATMTIELPPQKEIIEFEVSSSTSISTSDSSAPASAPAESKGSPIAPPHVETAQAEEPVSVPPEQVEPAPVVAVKPILLPKKAAPSKSIPSLSPPVEPKSMTLAEPKFDQDLEEVSIVTPVVSAAMSEKEINDEIEQDLDQDIAPNEETLNAAVVDLDKSTQATLSENDQLLAETKKSLVQEEDQLQSQMKEQIISDKKAALAALKAENAAREAAIAGLTGNGVIGQVRDVSELRQVPGNRAPQYEEEDRFKQRQGDIAFVAYVTREGRLTQFKLLKGTGYKSLDLKTLAALKNWKFYPGQEGWVEVGFVWELKGGAKEKPATLRRKISRN